MTKQSNDVGGKKQESKDIEATQDRPVFVPATDIYESPEEILVVCDMPAVDEKNAEVRLEEGVLTIVGLQDLQEPEGHQRLHRGYDSGVYRRSFTVSAQIDSSKIQAKMDQGVLRLVLPKFEEAKPRKITVQAGA